MEKDSKPEASDSRPEKPDEHQLIVWLVAAASPGEGLIEEFVGVNAVSNYSVHCTDGGRVTHVAEWIVSVCCVFELINMQCLWPPNPQHCLWAPPLKLGMVGQSAMVSLSFGPSPCRVESLHPSDAEELSSITWKG